MNGSMLTGARVPYAVARDGLAPAALAHLSAGGAVPTISVVGQGALSCLLAGSGSFDELTDAVVFASWLFYALNAGSVVRLRRREPDRERPFRVPGFPVVPSVFVVLAILLIANTIWTTLKPSALGLGVTALGALIYAASCATRRARISSRLYRIPTDLLRGVHRPIDDVEVTKVHRSAAVQSPAAPVGAILAPSARTIHDNERPPAPPPLRI